MSQVQEVPVAAHDHVGVKGASGLENAIVCRISPDDLDHLARIDHHGDPGHLGDGRLDAMAGDRACLRARPPSREKRQPGRHGAGDGVRTRDTLPGTPTVPHDAPPGMVIDSPLTVDAKIEYY